MTKNSTSDRIKVLKAGKKRRIQLVSSRHDKGTTVTKIKPPPQPQVQQQPKIVFNPYLREILRLKKTIPSWDNIYAEDAEDKFEEHSVRIRVLGQPLQEKYSWAIPNNKALRILSHFSPLVEIGSGKGYWASLLIKLGVDIRCYDKYEISQNRACWTKVRIGDPASLSSKKNKGRNLFLCYPDDREAMAVECLNYFTGTYIIHVGELLHQGTRSGPPQAGWGRTSSADFQVRLSEEFHCLLSASLPSFPFAFDRITVWKRTRFVKGLDLSDDDADDELDELVSSNKRTDKTKKPLKASSDADTEYDEGSEESQSEDNNRNSSCSDEDSNLWADIPVDEVMPDNVAPCLQFLLQEKLSP